MYKKENQCCSAIVQYGASGCTAAHNQLAGKATFSCVQCIQFVAWFYWFVSTLYYTEISILCIALHYNDTQSTHCRADKQLPGRATVSHSVLLRVLFYVYFSVYATALS